MITGDSFEYEFLDNAVKQLTDPIGVSVELGVRRGQGSKSIIDALIEKAIPTLRRDFN